MIVRTVIEFRTHPSPGSAKVTRLAENVSYENHAKALPDLPLAAKEG
jgi:hypothetical protein